MTAITTQGSKLSFAIQTDFNTPNTSNMVDVRLEGNPDIETPVGTGVQPEFVGANPHQNEKPIVEDQASDSAVVCTTLIRQALTAGNNSFISTAFEAGGYSVVNITTDTTVDGVGTVAAIPATDDAGMVAGMGVNIELDDGSWEPTLIKSMSGSSIEPTMELQSLPSAANAINKAFTITPANLAQVANDKILTFLAGNKSGTIQAQDCALTSVGDLVFNPNEKLMLQFTFGASDKDRGDTPMTGSNTFADSSNAQTVHQPWCEFTDTPALWSTGVLSRATHKVISATITFNVTAEQVAGFGDENCKNNIQGWMQKAEPATIELDMLYDSTKLSDFDDANASKYISISQYGKAEGDPSIGFFMPNAHQMDAPICDYYGNNEHRVKVKYVANPSEMDGTTSSDQGNQPWYLIIGDRS